MNGIEDHVMWNKPNSKHYIFCPKWNLDLPNEEEEWEGEKEGVDEER